MDAPRVRSRLLVVEDDDNLARSLVRALERAGHEVAHAPDGKQASELLTRAAFDLVLSDIMLPGLSGVDLLRRVRAADLDVPVILMTGNPSVETAAQAVELGALKYLLKPVSLDVLLPTVERAVRLGKLARAKREALMLNDGEAPAGDQAGLAVSFERALDTLWLAFQPIVDARKKRTVAYEALLRTREPSMPNPTAVIDTAERLGQVHVLGRKVRALAAAAVARMPADAQIFVNLHPMELTDPELHDPRAPLSAHAARVVLEITERSALESVNGAAGCARKLRDAGFELAVDDLGAGYAGLTTFATLEPEIVKLDHSLIRGCHESETRQRIVRSVVALSREMSMRVVAEGIETAAELACVRQLGCDLLQGFFLGRPAAELAEAKLADGGALS
jgi:EAL domain-containing protein (putative c-di-GMP-specific phosphodiesterase class I)/CheY-like chemotaxis protein